MTDLYLGAILADLVKHFEDLQINALVRNENHVEAVRKLGVEVVRTGDNNKELITKHARTADITVNAAGSDDVDLTKAILEGQKARVVEDNKKPAVLFHTSGVAVFAGSELDGRHDPDLKLWNVRHTPRALNGFEWRRVLIAPPYIQDGNEEHIREIDSRMLHGDVDVLYVSFWCIFCFLMPVN